MHEELARTSYNQLMLFHQSLSLLLGVEVAEGATDEGGSSLSDLLCSDTERWKSSPRSLAGSGVGVVSGLCLEGGGSAFSVFILVRLWLLTADLVLLFLVALRMNQAGS